jgi:hypothetical protein
MAGTREGGLKRAGGSMEERTGGLTKRAGQLMEEERTGELMGEERTGAEWGLWAK